MATTTIFQITSVQRATLHVQLAAVQVLLLVSLALLPISFKLQLANAYLLATQVNIPLLALLLRVSVAINPA